MKDARSAAGLAPVGRMVNGLARPVFARYGFAVGAILTEWRAIVGVPLADHAQPERLAFPRGQRRDGTLHLRVESAWAPEVQHLSHRLIERINAHFGFRAVARITLRHAVLAPDRRPLPQPPAVAPPPEVEGASDLDRALAALGAAMAGRVRRKGG